MSDDEGVQNVAKTEEGGVDWVVECRNCGTLRSIETPLCPQCYPFNARKIRAPFVLFCVECARLGPTTRADSVRYGWTEILFTPDRAADGCYEGLCPQCKARE